MRAHESTSRPSRCGHARPPPPTPPHGGGVRKWEQPPAHGGGALTQEQPAKQLLVVHPPHQPYAAFRLCLFPDRRTARQCVLVVLGCPRRWGWPPPPSRSCSPFPGTTSTAGRVEEDRRAARRVHVGCRPRVWVLPPITSLPHQHLHPAQASPLPSSAHPFSSSPRHGPHRVSPDGPTGRRRLHRPGLSTRFHLCPYCHHSRAGCRSCHRRCHRPCRHRIVVVVVVVVV